MAEPLAAAVWDGRGGARHPACNQAGYARAATGPGGAGRLSGKFQERTEEGGRRTAMAELSAADSVQAVASEQEVLLATKLHVPGSRPGLVPRPPADWTAH